MTHSGFILAAYLAGALVIGGLTLWVVFDNRLQQRKLQQLEADGLRRRSSGRGDAEKPGSDLPGLENS